MARAYYNENNPYAAQWLRNLIAAGLIAPGEVDERSIASVRADDLRGFDQCHFFAGIGVWSAALREVGWPDGREVWTGSCPCQPFSAAGKQRGFADDRHLWPEWIRLIRERRPKRILGEQVASKDGLAWLDVVHADLEEEGYVVGAVDLCAAGLGAPHIRQRLWFVADAGRASDERVGGPGKAFSTAGEIEGGARQWERRGDDFGDCRGALSLAVADEGQRGRIAVDGWSVAHGADGGRTQDHGEPAGRRATHVVEHAAGDGRNEGRPASGERGACGGRGADAVSGVALGDAERARLERFARYGDGGGQPGRVGTLAAGSTAEAGAVVRPGPVNGFWRDSDWIACTDGKWRPVMPFSQPLAHGSAFRVGSGGPFAGKSRAKMLCGYGNAINKFAAAAFIEAVMEIDGPVIEASNMIAEA